jgi:hypothetical protein
MSTAKFNSVMSFKLEIPNKVVLELSLNSP